MADQCGYELGLSLTASNAMTPRNELSGPMMDAEALTIPNFAVSIFANMGLVEPTEFEQAEIEYEG